MRGLSPVEPRAPTEIATGSQDLEQLTRPIDNSLYCDNIVYLMAAKTDGDEKLQRFERVAEKRVSDLIRRIRLIGNLSNRSNYAYTERHVRHMFVAVEKELKAARSRFDGVSGAQVAPFTFRTRG